MGARVQPAYTTEQRHYIWTQVHQGTRYPTLTGRFKKQFDRCCPSYSTCMRIYNTVEERGYPEDHRRRCGRKRTVTGPAGIASVLQDIQANPDESMRKRALRLGISNTSLNHILKVIKTKQEEEEPQDAGLPSTTSGEEE